MTMTDCIIITLFAATGGQFLFFGPLRKLDALRPNFFSMFAEVSMKNKPFSSAYVDASLYSTTLSVVRYALFPDSVSAMVGLACLYLLSQIINVIVGPGGLRAPCVLACAMRIVIIVVVVTGEK